MKINHYYEASTEQTPLNEIELGLQTCELYEIKAVIEETVKNDPTRVITVKYSIEITY